MIKRCAAILGAFTILFGTVPFYNASAATEGSTKFSVDVNQAVLELTVPSSPAVIDLNPTMTNASFGSTSINVHVATNNQTGYTLTMTPTNNTYATSLIRTELIGDEEDYREIETLELTDPISTGYTEQTFTTNAWGYKITGDNYYGIDPNNTTVSHPAWTTDAPTNGTNHILTLAAKVDADTVSGSYETTLNFRAVTNSTIAKDTISFDANGGTGTMKSIIVVGGDSTALPANTFTAPANMKFIGWATTQSGLGEGVVYYGDEATYTAISTGVNKSVTLYAQWTLSSTPISPIPSGTTGTTFTRAYEIAYTAMHKGMYEKDESVGGDGKYHLINSWPPDNEQYHNYDVRFAMQDMTPEICASVTAMHDDYEALDLRDDKLYHITKLQDGNCWMTENLDYNLPATAITSETTDLTQYGTLRYDSSHGYSQDANTGIISWTPACATLDPSTISTSTGQATGWDYCNRNMGDHNYAPSSLDLGEWYVNTQTNNCFYWREGVTCDDIATTPFTNTNGTHGSIGNLYNYAAAVASNDTNDFVLVSNDATEFPYETNSICPKGWRLPVAVRNGESTNPKNEAAYVNNLYGGNGHTNQSPQYLIGAGRINSGGISNVGNAYYETNTPAGPSTNAGVYYNLTYDFSHFGDSWGKGIGNSVRCLAR